MIRHRSGLLVGRPTVIPSFDRHWCVGKTKAHAERQLASVLKDRQITTYLPLLKRKHSVEPLFPGYLFLKIDWHSDELLYCRSAPGMSYILSSDGVPIPVTEQLIDEIKSRMDRHHRLGPASMFTAGDRVVVTSNPFRGLEAVFDRRLTPQGRCHVLLQMLGQQVRVQVRADQLKRICS